MASLVGFKGREFEDSLRSGFVYAPYIPLILDPIKHPRARKSGEPLLLYRDYCCRFHHTHSSDPLPDVLD